jgi:low affinity Fe/Cu permease
MDREKIYHRHFSEHIVEIAVKIVRAKNAVLVAFCVIGIALILGFTTGFTSKITTTWQACIAYVTFLWLFIEHRAMAKDMQATQIKLNEILAAVDGASNRLVNVEEQTEEEIQLTKKTYQELAHMVEATASTSIEFIDRERDLTAATAEG